MHLTHKWDDTEAIIRGGDIRESKTVRKYIKCVSQQIAKGCTASRVGVQGCGMKLSCREIPMNSSRSKTVRRQSKSTLIWE